MIVSVGFIASVISLSLLIHLWPRIDLFVKFFQHRRKIKKMKSTLESIHTIIDSFEKKKGK